MNTNKGIYIHMDIMNTKKSGVLHFCRNLRENRKHGGYKGYSWCLGGCKVDDENGNGRGSSTEVPIFKRFELVPAVLIQVG